MYQADEGLDTRTLDLDNLTSLEKYDRLLTLSQRRLKNQVECNAQARVIFTKLGQIDALEIQITVDHGSELNIRPTLKTRFEEERKLVSSFRLGLFMTYWRSICKVQQDNLE